MKDRLKISVALCTYNGAQFLGRQLESIVHQSRRVDEIIICDDGSGDDTMPILESFVRKHPDKINVYRNAQPMGPIKNFEKAVKQCSGDLIFLSDQDDVWQFNKVELLTSAFANDKNALLFFTNGSLIDAEEKKLPDSLWGKWKFTDAVQKQWRNNNNALSSLVINRNFITGATVAFRKSLKEYIFPFKVPCGYWHDTWIGTHAAALNGLRFLPDRTVLYRVHAGQQIGIGNGVSLRTGDEKYGEPLSIEEYRNLLSEKFPRKKKIIFQIPSLQEKVIHKTKFIFSKIKAHF